jgi:hypothetical protein
VNRAVTTSVVSPVAEATGSVSTTAPTTTASTKPAAISRAGYRGPKDRRTTSLSPRSTISGGCYPLPHAKIMLERLLTASIQILYATKL